MVTNCFWWRSIKKIFNSSFLLYPTSKMDKLSTVSTLERDFIMSSLKLGLRVDGRSPYDTRLLILTCAEQAGVVTVQLGRSRYSHIHTKKCSSVSKYFCIMIIYDYLWTSSFLIVFMIFFSGLWHVFQQKSSLRFQIDRVKFIDQSSKIEDVPENY